MRLAKFESEATPHYFYYILPTSIESIQRSNIVKDKCYIITRQGNEIHIKDTLENNVNEINYALNYNQLNYDDDRPL